MKKYFTKEIIIALVTIASLFILYAGINYLKGLNIFKPSNHYFVKMNNVSELQKSSPIYVDGFRVGIVNNIEYGYDNQDGIIVQISLDDKMKVETGSYFQLQSGLTSGAYLNLILNKYVSSYCQPGDTLEGIAEKGMMDKLATNLIPQIENILPRLDSILLGVQTLVNHPALSQSLEQIAATTSNLEKSTLQLNHMLSADVPKIMSNINQVSEDFTVISGNFKQLDINSTMHTVDKTIQSIDQMVNQLNNKNSSLGLLLNDRGLYDRLDSTATNASNLLLDLRQNPKRYVHFSVF